MPNIIPFGDRVLVKRKVVGEKVGKIFLPDSVSKRATDLAVVVHIPENSSADTAILESAEEVVKALTEKAKSGDSEALITLLRLNEFCRWKSIQVGDEVFISQYVGTTFIEKGSTEELTIVKVDDIIGLVVKDGE